MLRAASSCFLLLLLAAGAFGAEADEPAPEAAEESADETETSSAPEGIDAAMAEEIREAEEAAASAQPDDANEPFVPSVQISEDLSVSFPVDI